MTKAFIGLGSNLGDRERFLREAVEAMEGIPETEVERVSSFYDSDPQGDPAQPAYLNAVAGLQTGLSPDRLLWNLQLIEFRLGRPRARRNGPRTIDLDLLFYGDEVIDRTGLTVPHPRYPERPFVLVPLVELEPGLVDPRTGMRVDRLLRDRRNVASVRWVGRFRP
jgi:2-amino-4-hydroxy-6-hydroxymethyldihydropteridine diphosphokinase